MQLRNDGMTKMFGKAGFDVCDGLYQMVSKLAIGKGPKAEEVCEYDGFWLQVVKSFEQYITCDVSHPGKVDKSKLSFAAKPVVQTLVGKPAVQHIFEEKHNQFTNEKAPNPNVLDLKPLKTFSWLLSSGQREVLQQMNRVASSDGPSGALAVEDAGGSVSGGAKSSSHGALAVVDPCIKKAVLDAGKKGAPPNKKTMAKDASALASREKMLKFCYAPSKPA